MSIPEEDASAKRPLAPAQVCTPQSAWLSHACRIQRLTAAASTRTGNNSSIQPSSDEAGSEEDDVYGGAKGRSFARKHRRQKQASASGAGTPQVGEVRFSTRQAAKVTNYNEEDDYGLSESDTQDVTPNNWVVEQTGPSVDTVLNHRLNEGAGM
jgi:chromodomain-helicase-DNA-binding protein 1